MTGLVSASPSQHNDAQCELSIVIAVLDEQDNLPQVCRELAEAMQQLPAAEVVFVDDGSQDQTVEVLQRLRDECLPSLRILSHDRRCGKSAALRTGITAARGTWIATIDGDGQDDPRELGTLVSLAQVQATKGRAPLVVGVRTRRKDGWSRRFATRFANGLRQKLLNDQCPDTGAPIKIFQRIDFLRLPQFEGLHRFLPALFASYGVPLVCHPVTHRPRLHGHSKYTNFNRAVVGVRDLLGVMWLRNRTHLPKSIREC
ncbi:glycosyltransferase family 2 protein [Acetobacter ascendens]|uniref:Dolichyl-phosphate beta-D-mannosyltransferase n=1 Tax=Acetobacter ascendens TaxID=481146 RepID=A0A1Y0UXC6_9PROT|nr:glycosyltransferase family 2 protein [Acetobacter ascendens]ARW10562.1 Dolichyl-phosphate beta-D-mannosyltransferase [Acetobacter ascendens]RCL07907.1 glycosyl transferase [Acetobacter pasteurianus]GCD76021.1 dolichol-phosphate mannosyltransferase [Acetobacter pasteurianus NBRC 3299]